ncbi:MAG: winged helix-turn-helix transcriptional regulator [Nonomuraea sp.]|nr:winged helix-turn-helix transcriptional regulator [Nonomuraea sp.]
MLRLHFSVEDLARVRLAPGPDAMWEIALSVHQLAFPTEQVPFFTRWRHRTSRSLAHGRLRAEATALATLVPAASYFPDFLTPAGHEPAVEVGIDTVLRSPKARIGDEIAQLASGYRRTPGWMHTLASGQAGALNKLGATLRRYHAAAIAPHTAAMNRTIERDLAYRREVLATQGVEALLDGLNERVSWSDRVLRVRYPVDTDIHLEGRGLLLIPSFFCSHGPIGLADRSLPPVLVYPVRRPELWQLDREPGEGALDALIGPTRASVLRLLESPSTVSGLAGVLEVAPSTVSRHATVMRKAGLVRAARDGERVLLFRTDLGQSLLDG